MVDLKVDLGQIFILGLISIISWFVKREITSIHEKIDTNREELNESISKTQDKIFDLAGNVQKLMGMIANGRLK